MSLCVVRWYETVSESFIQAAEHKCISNFLKKQTSCRYGENIILKEYFLNTVALSR